MYSKVVFHSRPMGISVGKQVKLKCIYQSVLLTHINVGHAVCIDRVKSAFNYIYPSHIFYTAKSFFTFHRKAFIPALINLLNYIGWF